MNAHHQQKLQKLIESAHAVLDARGRLKNGKPPSIRTLNQWKEVMQQVAARLHEMGFILTDATHLQSKHIQAVCEKWHSDGLSAKTIQVYYSSLKTFCFAIKKPQIIDHSGKGVLPYLKEGVDPNSLKVRTAAEKSKSWSVNCVDVDELLQRVRAQDERLFVMVLLELAFGLRRKEALRIRPHQADKGDFVEISGPIGKSGRYRAIRYERETPRVEAWQRHCMKMAKNVCRKGEYLGWPGRTYEQNTRRYNNLMRKIGITKGMLGITGHGARATFAERSLLLRGILPATLGGTQAQGKAQIQAASLQVQHLMGHGDLHAARAYYGEISKEPLPLAQPQVLAVQKLATGEVAQLEIFPHLHADAQGVYPKVSAQWLAHGSSCVR